MINIVYEDNHLLVVEKPVNMPVQEDDSKDKDLLTSLKEYIKKEYKKEGNVYLAMIHRLDRPVGGLLVFAKTSKAAERLNSEMKLGKIKKEYYAVIEGVVTEKKGTFVDNILKDERNNTVKIDRRGKESILEYKVVKVLDLNTLVKINLKTGRKHQIRLQFASRGYPIFGDQRYNDKAIPGEQIALFAKCLEFIHPTTKEVMKFELELPNRIPFNNFK